MFLICFLNMKKHTYSNISKGWSLMLSTGQDIFLKHYLKTKLPNMTSLQHYYLPRMLLMQVQLNTYHWYLVLYQSLNTSEIPNNVLSGYPCEPPIVISNTILISFPTIWLQMHAIDPSKALINILHYSNLYCWCLLLIIYPREGGMDPVLDQYLIIVLVPPK